MAFRYRPAKRQSNTASGIRIPSVKTFKQLEDTVFIPRFESNAMVREVEMKPVCIALHADVKLRRLALAMKFDRIADEVQQAKMERGCVCRDIRQIAQLISACSNRIGDCRSDTTACISSPRSTACSSSGLETVLE